MGTCKCVYDVMVHVCCSFTLEASFAGPDTGALAGSHYDMSHLESLGAHLALALLDYSDPGKSAQAAAAMRQAVQQAPQQPAPGVQSRQSDGESSECSISDGATAVSCGAVLYASIIPGEKQSRINIPLMDECSTC